MMVEPAAFIALLLLSGYLLLLYWHVGQLNARINRLDAKLTEHLSQDKRRIMVEDVEKVFDESIKARQ